MICLRTRLTNHPKQVLALNLSDRRLASRLVAKSLAWRALASRPEVRLEQEPKVFDEVGEETGHLVQVAEASEGVQQRHGNAGKIGVLPASVPHLQTDALNPG
jgi:hypothetical protein